ncbi:hypothetical protein [Variovorax ginsengisoli]|uniref:DUF4129 domain-containing protein n=1 Tax=Variovorax ginsengisoli TaxID=363844 RepID=A0ABT8SDI7_9BURK|nr:hypothetical protein [Variovorax ginsengisoli]MDN8617812.1 hypothetical protein [Variovorax ginsengisoli]MDO1536982.1 hypothetical protein [Variovorax ginsengisoli]
MGLFDGPWETCMLVRGLNPSECASWVQAWGTILAISAAVLIAFVQHRQNLRQRRQIAADERARTLAAPLAVAQRAERLLRDLHRRVRAVNGAYGEWGAPAGMKEQAMKLHAVFVSLPLHLLPTYELILVAYEIAYCIADGAERLDAMAVEKERLGAVSASSDGSFEVGLQAMRELCTRFERERLRSLAQTA